ncbi:cysteine proteinase inhibitor B [Nicotiana tabacum]|uniref:Cysteine protease inhibitor n=1 Tax=Nicotiana tabacum TaxID=4097 RepID=A0A075FB34_TOBAC|nr:cysteine proteinase inhibitor B-like [Nicotiana tomentosiformis]XP_016490860.1 PREDICTED: cysteine proteinase inhibitor B-like [Nicotiana tabacum]AIE76382.1 cysteine protease inhibitor [Nicotiana tabacum]
MTKFTKIISLLSTLFIIATFSSTPSNVLGRKVGGRTPIKDVKTNKKIQDLGKYCVEEYNRSLRKYKQILQEDNIEFLSFAEVLEAETQVVSGIKYYLKISAIVSSGIPKTFDAELVIKPWEEKKELIHFLPFPAHDKDSSIS